MTMGTPAHSEVQSLKREFVEFLQYKNHLSRVLEIAAANGYTAKDVINDIVILENKR